MATVLETQARSDACEKEPYQFCTVARLVKLSLCLVIIVPLIIFCWKPKTQPHIIVFMVDDMGWSDVSFNSDGQIPTPNIDAMCSDGIRFDSHYAQPSGSQSKAALHTGKYPIRLGLQELPISGGKRQALSKDHQLLPQYLKKLGYSTHYVGTWQLGYYASVFLPTNRGFDSFYGSLNGEGTYYNHTYAKGEFEGYDWHFNNKVDRSAAGKYVTNIITDRVRDIVKQRTGPMFLMISHMAPRGSNDRKKVFEVDKKWINDPGISHIKERNRTAYGAMIRSLDDAFGQTIAALNDARILEDSIILFTSDSGGSTMFDKEARSGASTWPLRGQKFTMWEGGVRVPSFLWTPLIPSAYRRYTNRQLYHLTDWFPTFYKLAGGKLADLPKDIDGVDIWESISQNSDSPRKNLLINIDTGGENFYAVRNERFKLINGTPPNVWNGTWHNEWYTVPGGRLTHPIILQNQMMNSITYNILSNRVEFEKRNADWRDAAKLTCEIDNNILDSPRGEIFTSISIDQMRFASKRTNATICVDPKNGPCLFDIRSDPCELTEYAGEDRQLIINELVEIVNKFRNVTQTPLSPWKDKDSKLIKWSDPKLQEGAWIPWEYRQV